MNNELAAQERPARWPLAALALLVAATVISGGATLAMFSHPALWPQLTGLSICGLLIIESLRRWARAR